MPAVIWIAKFVATIIAASVISRGLIWVTKVRPRRKRVEATA